MHASTVVGPYIFNNETVREVVHYPLLDSYDW